jgi:hypothetical protein
VALFRRLPQTSPQKRANRGLVLTWYIGAEILLAVLATGRAIVFLVPLLSASTSILLTTDFFLWSFAPLLEALLRLAAFIRMWHLKKWSIFVVGMVTLYDLIFLAWEASFPVANWWLSMSLLLAIVRLAIYFLEIRPKRWQYFENGW